VITKEEIRKRREEITSLAARHGAHDVRIFGSAARSDATEVTDLDLLVRFESARSLIDYGMLVDELQNLLGVRVDVVSEDALSPGDRFRDRLSREAVPL
jgi:predicted nucleotidyltransferase